MASEEKPYRVYRSRRTGPKLPKLSRRSKEKPSPSGRPPRLAAPASRRRRIVRWLTVGLAVFLLWLVAWSLAGYFSFRDGVSAANDRLPVAARKELVDDGGLVLTNDTVILVLGTDTGPDRKGLRHSDSMMLMRVDPDHHHISYLSIPRDLLVSIPGHGRDKINAAYQIGGAPLTLATVRDLTGLDVNHVIVVDFARFRDLIDGIGGIDVNVPRPIESNPFECPYDAARCASWAGWRFAKGRQHMDGRRALVYSRIRSNRLDPADNDLTRAERQQQVLQAIAGKIAGVGTFLKLPFTGGDLLRPLATDLTANEFAQLGWVYWRSDDGKALHCRLGGTPDGGYIRGETDRNLAALAMFTGDSAAQPPFDAYDAGCVVGNVKLGPR